MSLYYYLWGVGRLHLVVVSGVALGLRGCLGSVGRCVCSWVGRACGCVARSLVGSLWLGQGRLQCACVDFCAWTFRYFASVVLVALASPARWRYRGRLRDRARNHP